MELEEENTRLLRLVAELLLKNQRLRSVQLPEQIGCNTLDRSTRTLHAVLRESNDDTLYEDGLTQMPIASRVSRIYMKSPATTLMSMVCGALALRLIVVAASFLNVAAPSPDHGQFGAEMGWVARSLALGQGFSSPFFPRTGPTALVPPLFPYLLAQIFRLFGIYSAKSVLVILSLDSLFSALTCIPIYLSLKYAAGERPAQLAGWIWAIYPFAIYFSGAQVWDYALTSLLFACCFCLGQRLHLQQRFRAWLGFGALCGIATLSNPSILSQFPFLLLIALWRLRHAGRSVLLRAVVAFVGLIIIVAPWAVRNDRMMGAASPIRDGFWLEFWAGNTGDTSASNPAWAHPASNPIEMRMFESEGETAYLAHKQARAVSFVRSHPFRFAAVSVRRAARFWTGFWSFRHAYLRSEPLDIPNVFFCTCITGLMVQGMWLWWKIDRDHASPYLVTLITFPLPYYFTHSSMDYRQPIEPQIVILVAVCLFGFRKLPTHSKVVRTSRQYQPEPQMVCHLSASAHNKLIVPTSWQISVAIPTGAVPP